MKSIINIKFLFRFLYICLLIQLSAGVVPGDWPAIDKPPPITPEFSSLVDFTKVADAPVRTLNDKCQTDDQFCYWSCTNCVRNETDIITCPNVGDWGLTLDDGPSEFTTDILNFLDAKNIKVTFFVVGSRVYERPDILLRAFNAVNHLTHLTLIKGHQIGVHTWSHPSLTTQTSEQIVAELEWTAKVIKAVLGVRPKYMRPPFGNYDDRVRDICKQLGYKVVIWDRDTNDWMSDEDKTFELPWVEANFSQWVKEPKAGHISLEHDLYQGAALQVPSVIPIVINGGYSIKQVGTCLGDNNFYQGNITNANTTIPVKPSTSVTPVSVSQPYASIKSIPSAPPSSSPSGTSTSAVKNSSAIKSTNLNYFIWLIIIGAILFNSVFF
ncbi:15558_t:CDS:2 [Cetraspora pellucida]|uniref:15558_t:CDS:1 n=1 Tax=Cetraspora pellucida TaxID=1433469 RepID=A0A9N9N6A3_9GLOM|nr:15558_t:CDS:2 [Cetraspora pellucida]